MTEGLLADVAAERKLREAAVAQLSVDVAHVRQTCERLDAGIREDQVARGAVTAELEEMLREVRGGAGLRAEKEGGRTPGREGIELAKLLEARADEMEATMALYRAEIADMQVDLSRLATQISEFDVSASQAAREPTQSIDALVVELRAETASAADRFAQESRLEADALRAELNALRKEAAFVTKAAEVATKIPDATLPSEVAAALGRVEALAAIMDAERADRTACVAEIRAEVTTMVEATERRLEQQRGVADEALALGMSADGAARSLQDELRTLSQGVAASEARLNKQMEQSFGTSDAIASLAKRLQDEGAVIAGRVSTLEAAAENVGQRSANLSATIAEESAAKAAATATVLESEVASLRTLFGTCEDLRAMLGTCEGEIGRLQVEHTATRAAAEQGRSELRKELQELEQRMVAAAQALGEDVRMQLHATKTEVDTLSATVTAVSEFCSEFEGRVADIEERLSQPEATKGADGVSSVASAAGGAAVNLESEVMDKVLAAVSAAEKRLLTRHEQLCVTLNIDLGRLEVRLDREIARLQKDDQMTPSRSAPAKPGGGSSQAAIDAELNRHSADNTDGLATFTLEAVEKRFQAQNMSFSANLQELGELVLGEIAALRSVFTAQAESFRVEMGQVGDGLVLVVEEIQRQHGTTLSLPHVLAGTG